ncbi:MAG: ABC transporter permease [Candidatus Adiutrix sp.]|jgi:ribose transport system permease protein|nr:ABC transporter permease [Candidatus Adiutrix sp.]
MGQVITVGLGLAMLCVAFYLKEPAFFSERNLANLSRQIVPILLVGIAQSYVLITGNIDLSIGSLAGMSCMVSATLMTKGVDPWAAVSLTLAACLAVGVVNGLLVAKCKLPPFIATLGTMIIARGLAQIVNNNYNTDSIGARAQAFRDLFYYGKTLGIFNPVWIAFFLWLVFTLVLAKTRTGRHIYAVGSNLEASRLSGVDVPRTVTIAYMVSAFCAGVVGLIFTASTGMGSMDAGNMYELYGVAAAVIGGVSTLGGQGILLGTFIGAAIWCVLQNGLQFAQAPVAIRNIVIGAIVIVSVLLDVILRQGRWKR